MNLSWTLSSYLSRNFFVVVALTFTLFLALIFMIDLVELMRRGSEREAVTFGLLVGMALLDLPRVAGTTLPFAVLFGGMAAFMRLTRNQEMVVVRASGVSVWQFLAPPLVVAFLMGTFVVTIYNPVSATMAARYEQLDSKYLKGRSSLLAVSKNGLWLRQADPKGQSVIHALRVDEQMIRLNEVTIFLYRLDNEYQGRIDAATALLRNGYWSLTDTWITPTEGQPVFHANYEQPTSLTKSQVEESFANPNTISFWELPHFIQTAEAAGFSARRYQIHFYEILATPLLLCTMVLIAAVFSLRVSRLGGLIQLIVGGIFSGFLVFFLGDLSLALGISGFLPPFLAAWAPSIVVMFLGLTVLFHLEDG